MIIISLIFDAVMVSAFVGLLLSLVAFLVSSLAPTGKVHLLSVGLLLFLFEIDWISLWFAALAYFGHGLTSKLEVWLAFIFLLIGIVGPICWLVFARVAIKRGFIRSVLIKLER